MRRRPLLALAVPLALAAAPAALGKDRPAEAAPGVNYVALSRALTEIDSADRRGELGDELAWAQAADANPQDLVAQFLAVAAQPDGDARWQGYRAMGQDHPESALPYLGMARVY